MSGSNELHSSMFAARCNSLNGIEAVSIESIAIPEPQIGQIQIKVAAAGANFADSLMTQGKYQERQLLPLTLGLELAGNVSAIGDGTRGFKIGDPVMAVVPQGAFAQFAVADVEAVFRLPDNVGFPTAAALAVNYGTAQGALSWKARLQPGEIVLVHGAAGGTGLAAVQVAKAMGATVIATARGKDRAQIAKKHGADIVLSSDDDGLIEEIKSAAVRFDGGRGRVDVVFDTVGGKLFDASLRCLAPHGRIMIIGFAGGDVPAIPANILLVKNADVMGFYWGSHRFTHLDRWRTGLEWLIEQLPSAKIEPILDQQFALKDTVFALNHLLSRNAVGKVIIRP